MRNSGAGQVVVTMTVIHAWSIQECVHMAEKFCFYAAFSSSWYENDPRNTCFIQELKTSRHMRNDPRTHVQF